MINKKIKRVEYKEKLIMTCVDKHKDCIDLQVKMTTTEDKATEIIQ